MSRPAPERSRLGPPPRPAAGGAAPAALLPQDAVFVADVFDALPKDDLGSMEHPMFSLSTRPDLRILRYGHNGVAITVTPSVKGLATIHDKDVLIFCISQLMAAMNAGRPVARTLRLKAADLMAATGREASGDGYARLREAFERLAGTRITTNIVTGGVETTTGFGLIEGWRIVRLARPAGSGASTGAGTATGSGAAQAGGRAGAGVQSGTGTGGRMISVSVTLSDWLWQAVLSRSVLTLSRDYFGLRKPLERRVYEIARKHCGRQPEWRVSLEVLHKKSGSTSPRRVFRRMIRDMIAARTLPDYDLAEEPGDVIRVTPRGAPEPAPEGGPQAAPAGGTAPGSAPEATSGGARAAAPGSAPGSAPGAARARAAAPGTARGRGGLGRAGVGAGVGAGVAAGHGAGRAPPPLPPEVLDEARRLAPGWDVYALEADWRAYWAASGRVRLGSAAKAFLGYVRARTAAD